MQGSACVEFAINEILRIAFNTMTDGYVRGRQSFRRGINKMEESHDAHRHGACSIEGAASGKDRVTCAVPDEKEEEMHEEDFSVIGGRL